MLPGLGKGLQGSILGPDPQTALYVDVCVWGL